MGSRTLRPATPLQIARFGAVAATLRAACKRRGWGPSDLNKAIGRHPSYSSAYQWLNGKGAPSEENAAILSNLLDIPEAELRARPEVEPPPSKPQVTTSRPAPLSARTQADVLAFNVSSNGDARIRLDVTLPTAQAMPLLRMLLDAGMVFSIPDESA